MAMSGRRWRAVPPPDPGPSRDRPTRDETLDVGRDRRPADVSVAARGEHQGAPSPTNRVDEGPLSGASDTTESVRTGYTQGLRRTTTGRVADGTATGETR